MATKETIKTDTNLQPTNDIVSTYTLEDLQKHTMELFNVSVATFVGATYGMDNNQKYTTAEIKKTIEEWCRKAVK